MDIYHVWADKEGDISDIDWTSNMRAFLDQLVEEHKIESFRITRCKLGFRSIQDLPEWHIMIETKNMSQLENYACHRTRAQDLQAVWEGAP